MGRTRRATVVGAIAGMAMITAMLLGSTVPATGAPSANGESWLHPIPSGTFSAAEFDDISVVTGGDGRPWFGGIRTVTRINADGSPTRISIPGAGTDDLAVAPAQGSGVWVWQPVMQDSTAHASLWKVGSGGSVAKVADFPAGKAFRLIGSSADGTEWFSSGGITYAVSVDGTVATIPQTVDLWLGNGVSSPVSPGADDSVWTPSADESQILHLGADGSVASYPSPFGHGDLDIAGFAAVQDGVWLISSSGQVVLLKEDGTTVNVLAASEAGGSAAPIIMRSPADDSAWAIRRVIGYPAADFATEVVHASSSGTVTYDKVLASDPIMIGGSAPLASVDEAGNVWFSAFPTTSTAPLLHVDSVSPAGKLTSFAPVETGGGTIYGLLTGDGNGHEWAYDIDGDVPKITEFDLATGTTRRYPISPDVNVESITIDGSGRPWFGLTDFGSGGYYYGSTPTTSTVRVSGEDRYATAVAISRAAYPMGANTVFIASGQAFPDGLSAAAAAGHAGAPVLLTPSGALPSSVAAEVKRLAPKKIVVAGGKGAVSSSVVAQLKTIQKNLVRSSGADRYATSRAIASEAFGASGASTVFLADGRDYPDGLTASAAAGKAGGPVILVNGGEKGLDEATTSLIRALKPSRIRIIGGAGAISSGIQTSATSIASTERLSGADRYATAEAVATSMGTTTPAWSQAFIASGLDFPDALGAGAWAAATGHPILLSHPGGIPQRAIDELNDAGTAQVTVIGGQGALGAAVADLQPAG